MDEDLLGLYCDNNLIFGFKKVDGTSLVPPLVNTTIMAPQAY